MNTYKPDYVARKETKNVILRPQVSPKNPKSWIFVTFVAKSVSSTPLFC